MKISIQFDRNDFLKAYIYRPWRGTVLLIVVVQIFVVAMVLTNNSRSVEFIELDIVMLILFGSTIYKQTKHSIYRILGLLGNDRSLVIDLDEDVIRLIGKTGAITINLNQIENITIKNGYYYIKLRDDDQLELILPQKELNSDFISRLSYFVR